MVIMNFKEMLEIEQSHEDQISSELNFNKFKIRK